jgi:phosphate transport system permease protein
MTEAVSGELEPIGGSAISPRYMHWRNVKDRLFRWLVASGGLFVVAALVSICVYLLYVVLPLFEPASAALARSLVLGPDTPEDAAVLMLDEYSEIGFAAGSNGTYAFFATTDGTVLERGQLASRQPATSVTLGEPKEGLVGAGFADGTFRIARVAYEVSYPNDRRVVTPQVRYPYGEAPLRIGRQPITMLALQGNDDEATVASVDASGKVVLTSFGRSENLLSGEVDVDRQAQVELPFAGAEVARLRIDVDQRELYVLMRDGQLHFVNVQDKAQPALVDSVDVRQGAANVTAMEFLSGGISLLLGDENGELTQWFPVRGEDGRERLRLIRRFEPLPAAVRLILPEYFRKGFAAIDVEGRLGLYHTTAQRTLLIKPTGAAPVNAVLGPRADNLLLLGGERRAQVWRLANEHPEVSWSSLWGKVWYESRAQPEFTWQSSSASSDFEPKFSLTPLTFGTLKASIYAMGFAVPVAILGAMYTAYFMSGRMRRIVKPSVEVMAALPTVILGFLAGLWFAPLVERHLPGVFLIFLLVPLACLLASFAWASLPLNYRKHVAPGWEAALLVPVICLVGWACMEASQPIEVLFFGGDMPRWVTEHLGLSYDQRNSLIVGVAVGIAVIPTVFSISEDAIFEVPRHLTMGSLALGATPWQTMLRVVLLTASPGIFSAVMIGLGRAVGETMIVLMATGNTPIMDLNIFQGFRALSANIAVEMPESEVGSTHYRILFLAALVLFGVTFVFNTAAEIVRQRLRVRYSNL